MSGVVVRCRARGRGDDEGSATVWMIGVTVATFAMIGLLLDGGAMLRARSDAFSVASSAARAGAQQLDPVAAVEGESVLDPVAAQRAAQGYLSAHGYSGNVVVDGFTVTVNVTSAAHLQLLKLAGGDTATFHATASAQAVKVVP
jgi:Flp pilus assembly protein TadG